MQNYYLEIDRRKGTLTKEKYLTLRWSNLLSLGLGGIFLAYSIVVLSTSVLSDTAGFIGLMIIGVLY